VGEQRAAELVGKEKLGQQQNRGTEKKSFKENEEN
jgi:hypothetical protein